MPTGAAIVGGLNAGTQLAQLKQQQRRDAFDQQQAQLGNYESIVGNAEKALQRLQEEMAIKRAAAPSLDDQKLIDDKYAEIYKSIVTPISRAGEKAFQRGVPVDTPVQLARLIPYQQLPDLNAQAVVEAQSAGGVKAAERTASLTAENQIQPLDQAKMLLDEQGNTIAVTKSGEMINLGKLQKMPSTQNVNQVSRAAPTAGTGEKPEGIGRQVMADTEQSAGIIGGISKGLSSIFGQFIPGTNERLDAAQRVKNFNQEIKFALSRNPKYPVAEMKAIQNEMLISPDAWLVDPESEARKVVLMKHSLEKWNEADRLALPRLTDDKAQDALERIGTRQTMIDLIGDVPSLEESDKAEIETLEAKVADDTATDAEIDRYMELVK